MGQSRPKTSAAVTPEPLGPKGYARYPIHVERAVYRLSHIKLANPRRPLHEQVLISNLMFWYLGIINKPAAPQQPVAQPQAPATPQEAQTAAAASAEREEQDHQERERLEREQAAMAAEREEQPKRDQQSPRKGLNKGPAGGVDPRSGARRAEMPVKSPQYGIGMVMEQGVGYEVQDSNQRHNGPNYPPSGYDSYQQDSSSQPSNGPPSEQSYHQVAPATLPSTPRTSAIPGESALP